MQRNKGSLQVVASANVSISLLVLAFMLHFPIAVPSGVEDQAPIPSGYCWVYPAFTILIGLGYSHFWKLTMGEHSTGFMQSFWQYFGGLFLLSPFVLVLIVLFGAPVCVLVDRTMSLAVVVCSLTVAPLCVNTNTTSPKELLNRIQTTNVRKIDKPGLTAYLSCLFTFAGTWLGSLLIPLDWDRPWQVGWAHPAYALASAICSGKCCANEWIAISNCIALKIYFCRSTVCETSTATLSCFAPFGPRPRATMTVYTFTSPPLCPP